jgi:tetratricopeptide (TPR) repeat protein
MLRARMVATALFSGFVFAAGGALHFAISAPQPEELAGNGLRETVRLNPRNSGAWIALGLEAEQAGNSKEAERCLAAAEKADRQYLPAWTSANFFFRRGDNPQFWRAAAQAAAMSYDDPAPLIALADYREPRAVKALDRLGDSARLERGFLHFLIGESRWREAQEVAARLLAREDPHDLELLLALTDRLITSGEGDAARNVWNALKGEREVAGVTNGSFVTQPSGHGFDWKMTAPPGGSAKWDRGRVRFWMGDSGGLLNQWMLLAAGQYRLRIAYRTEGLGVETGLRWSVVDDAREEARTQVLPQAFSGRSGDWTFRVTRPGLLQLRLVYARPPGNTLREGGAGRQSVDSPRSTDGAVYDCVDECRSCAAFLAETCGYFD